MKKKLTAPMRRLLFSMYDDGVVVQKAPVDYRVFPGGQRVFSSTITALVDRGLAVESDGCVTISSAGKARCVTMRYGIR